MPGTPLPKSFKRFEGLMGQLRALDADADVKIKFTSNWDVWQGSNYDPAVWLRLEWDAAVRYPDGTVDIVDFKTGKRYDGKNDDQLEVYALSAFIKYKAPVVTTRLWYLDSGLETVGPDDNRKPYTIDQMVPLLNKWNQRANAMLNATSYPPRPNKFCEYCPVSSLKGGPCAEG